MARVARAKLSDGRSVFFTLVDNPPNGSFKNTYFTLDRSQVVQFFKDPKSLGDEAKWRERLEAIIGRYNPTRSEADGGAKGNSEAIAKYFSHLFCWPTAIVTEPQLGILCPAYPEEFIFSENPLIHPEKNPAFVGKDKDSYWFTVDKNRARLRKEELGDFRNMLKISLSLARALRKMHVAGLAHSDLSSKNVLINPKNGTCIIIDIDSLVVPGLYPPECLGTTGYIAPEVLETQKLAYGDPARKMPCSDTDLHAMAVLIYEYLLLRHPLDSFKTYTDNSNVDAWLAMGHKALFIENPYDRSNRRDDIRVTIRDLGPALENLFLRAFVDGLHNPDKRPTAMEWERALVETLDLLQPCSNPDCEAKWFVLYNPKKPVCPFCGRRARKDEFARLRLSKPLGEKSGQWQPEKEINLYPNLPLFRWHMQTNTFPNEKTDSDMMAYVCKDRDGWLLVNRGAKGMTAPDGTTVPVGNALVLKNGAMFRICGGDKGFLAEVSCSKR